jgi:PAS domain S-box-containing protein
MRPIRRSIRLSLRLKLTLLIESIVVILVIITGLITTIREKETLENELRKRGLALASDLARFTERPLLSHDLPALRRFVNQAMGQDYVRYVIILDPNGRVVMHSDLPEVGKTYTDSLSIKAVRSTRPGYTDVHTGKDRELHSDMFAPIAVSDVRLGTIRLSYSHLAIQAQIAEAQQKIFLIGLLTAMGGGFIAYLLAVYISSPIKRITDATKNVALGRLDTQLVINRNDEIGALAEAFNRMTEDLQGSTVSKDYFDNIIKSMNDTLLVVGPDSKIRSVNKATCALLEYEEEDLIGQDMNLIVPEDEKMCGDALFKRLSQKSAIVNEETDYITKSRKRIPMLFSAAIMKDKEGKGEGAVCIARDVTERKQAEDALRESEKELHFLSSQLLTAQERERRRLSTELHDELGQSLMVLKLKLRSIHGGLQTGQDRLRAECDEGIGYIGDVIENVRRLSRDLSPAVLENLGLSAAIRRLTESFAKHTRVDFALDMGEIQGPFSQENEIIIYRMIQESLTNIAKHAEATHVSLTIREEEGCAFFRVEDNGKGFKLRETFGKNPGRKGLGLSAMYERARMLEGSIDIWSQEGKGTRISFTVPRHHVGGRT